MHGEFGVMSGIGAWILSILGIVVIGVVIDLILPSVKMNRYVKSVFAAVTVLVIVLPLPALVKNGCSSQNFIWNEDIPLQENYLEYTATIRKNSLMKGLRAALESEGITLGEADLKGDFSGSVPVIEEVSINLSQVVIVGQSEHINKYALIRNKVSAFLAVDEEVVRIYEQ